MASISCSPGDSSDILDWAKSSRLQHPGTSTSNMLRPVKVDGEHTCTKSQHFIYNGNIILESPVETNSCPTTSDQLDLQDWKKPSPQQLRNPKSTTLRPHKVDGKKYWFQIFASVVTSNILQQRGMSLVNWCPGQLPKPPQKL